MACSEELPVTAARGGDAAAWDQLLRRYQLPLYAYAFELLQDEQASLDAVQEGFTRAVRHLGSLREDEKFGSWMFGIVRQQCLQRWRRGAREKAALETLAGEVAEQVERPDEWLIRQEQSGEFLAHLDELPVLHREVLVLHFLEDFSLEEIAGVTGTPIGTVKSRLHYAKEMLRKRMKA